MSAPFPSVDVQVALADIPLAPTPTWTSLGGRVKSLTTVRGRDYEQDQSQVGSSTVVVDAHDGAMTPGSGLALAGLDTDRPLQILVTPPPPYDGTTYTVHRGAIDSFQPAAITGFDGTASTTIVSQDGLQTISQNPLESAYDQEILATGPTAFWPLSEAQGTTSFGSDVSAAGVLTPQHQTAFTGTGIGQYAAGADSLMAADAATSVDFAPEPSASSTGGSGWGLVTSTPAGVIQLSAAGFAISLLFDAAQNVPSGGFGAPSAGTLICQCLPTPGAPESLSVSDLGGGAGTGGGVSVCLPTGLGFFDAYGFTDGNAGTCMSDLKVHHLVVSVDMAAQTVTLWVDGIAHVQPFVTGHTVVLPAGWQLRVGDSWYQTGGDWFSGRIGKVALWNRPLTAAEVGVQVGATEGFVGELSGARASRILSYAGWPTGLRDIDAGETTAGPLVSAGQTANQLLQALAATEMGAWFVDGSGKACWWGRSRTRNTVSRQTLTCGADGEPEADLTPVLDRRHLLNVVQASRAGGPQITVVNQTAIARRRRYTQQFTFDTDNDFDVTSAASWLTAIYADPRWRISQVSIDPFTQPSLWPFAMSVQVLDRITIAGLPAYAPASSMDFIVQKVSHSAAQAPASWLTTLTLTPVELFQTLVVSNTPSPLTVVRNTTPLTVGY